MLPDTPSLMIRARRKVLAPLICCMAAFAVCIWFPTCCRATLTTIPDLSGHGHTGTLGTGFAGATSPTLNGSYAAFSNYTDTINLAGNVSLSNQATYEATVLVTQTTYTAHGAGGIIWNAWQDNLQDTRLQVLNGGEASAFSYPVNNPNVMSAGSLQTGVWYDLAYVYDGSQERLYVDGTLVGSRAASGTIGIGGGDTMTLGAIFRNGTIINGMQGDIASVRISNAALYSGTSYNAILGPSDFPDSASTQALYDFAPVPEPSSICMIVGIAAAGLVRRRRRM